MDLLVPDMVDDRYKVLDVIGTGAMATVYSAEDTRLGRKVAMKILRPEQAQDQTFRIRFKREAEAVASLNYPAIVAVYDTGAYSPTPTTPQEYGFEGAQPGAEDGSIPYIVMELVNGRTLREVLSSGAHLPVREAMAYADQLLGALQYSHDMGIIHRDIKPANIMVLPLTDEDISLGQSGKIKVMDFGISRALEEAGEALTKANVVLGSARYMSPEQVSGHEVDTRSDIYSAACVIYEMVAGRTPFDAESNVDLAAKHLSEAPQPPSAFSPLPVPPQLDAAIMRGLAKNPNERYQSADEFAQALRAAFGSADDDATVAQPALGAAAFVPYQGENTGTMEPPPDEEAGLNDFFEQDYYDACEEVEPETPRKRAWLQVLIGSLIVALLAFSVGSVLYYQNKLNEVPQVAVPSVVNVSKDEADTQLRNLGFTLEYKNAFSDTVKKGDVISVDPTAGTMIDKGAKVTLTVSNGPKKLVIPDNLQGQSEAYVRNALKEMGVVDGRVTTVESATVPAGMVVSLTNQSGEVLEPGAAVEAGQTVDLVLSSGKVKVPSLVGLTKDQAVAALTDPNTHLSTNVEEVQTSASPAGTVIAQSAAAGTLVEQNSTITIRVAKAPAQTATAAPVPSASARSGTSGSGNTSGGGANSGTGTGGNTSGGGANAGTGTGGNQNQQPTAAPTSGASASAAPAAPSAPASNPANGGNNNGNRGDTGNNGNNNNNGGNNNGNNNNNRR